MRVIIHIGTEKTGTTTLQRTLADNEASLSDNGLCYLHGRNRLNARDLAAACLPDETQDDYLRASKIQTTAQRNRFSSEVKAEFSRRLAVARQRHHTVIISSEHFHSRLQNADAIRQLREVFDGPDIEFRIIVYLRRQVDMVTSLYSTVLKGGGTSSFEDVTERMLRPSVYYCDFVSLINNWRRVFGTSALCVRRFVKERLKAGNIVDEFLHAAELPLNAVVSKKESTNESINPTGQVLVRELNRYLERTSGAYAGANGRSVRKRLSTAFSGSGKQLGCRRARDLQSRFDEINETIRREFFPSDERLFSDEFQGDDVSMLSAEQEEVVCSLVTVIGSNGTYTGTLRDYDAFADVLRDSSDLLARQHTSKAYELIKLASMIRPRGGLINKKRAKLEGMLARGEEDA